MAPIMLDILIVAVIALFAFLGWRRGLVLTLCGLLAVFVAYAGATFVSNTFSAEIAKILQPTIQGQIEQVLDNMISDLPAPSVTLPGQESVRDNAQASIDQATLNQALEALRQSSLFSGLQESAEQAIQEGTIRVVTTASAAIANYLALQVTRTVLFYLVFFLILIAWNLFSHALDLACRLPVLSTFNEVGGLIIGVVKGALILLAVVWLLSLAGIVSEETIQQTYLFRLYMNFQLM